ncbi:MAG: protoporphyrinogen oxidase [Gammaproteobacteria bacterium]
MNNVDVLVIGGGISGLAIARLLANTGLSVEVWERKHRPGGKICTHQYNGYTLEKSASMLLNFRPEINRFLEQCDLTECKTPLSPVSSRYLIHNNRLIKIPMELRKLIASPIWSLRGKMRLLVEPLIPPGGNEDETVAQFIRRRFGNEMLVKAMEPYIAGPLASSPDLANAYSTLPRLTTLERRYGSITMGVLVNRLLRRRTASVTESFSFKGGMSTLVESLANNAGFQFRKDCTATSLIRNKEGWLIQGHSATGEKSVRTRQVVLSVPAYVAASLIGDLNSNLQELLSGVEYAPVSVVHTGFRREAVPHPLDGNGFLIPGRCGLVSTGCLWMSRLFPGRAPEEEVLFSNYLGGTRMPVAATWNEEQSVAAVMEGLKPLLGIREEPVMIRIDRHKKGLPLYHGAYQKRTRAIDEQVQSLPGLHLAANYLGGVSVRDRIVCAFDMSNRIFSIHGKGSHEKLNEIVFANATV